MTHAAPERSSAPGLEISDLSVEYGGGDYVVRPIEGLSLAAADGELVALLGPSGCGKTTLLSCVAGLLTPTRGTVRYGGVTVTSLRGDALSVYRRTTVGIVFQAFNLVRSLTAQENVMAPLLLSGTSRRPAAERAADLLGRVGLADRMHHRPGDLSGGQQQRVAIARALVNDPPLLLADEPTAHLDHIQVEGIVRVLRELASPGRLVLLSTHDDRITRVADRVIDMVPSEGPKQREETAVLLEPGDILFHQGDRADFVYLVQEGAVTLTREGTDGSETQVMVARAGDYFGELGPILGLPRSATARAIEHTRLAGLPPHKFSRERPPADAPPARPAAE